MNVPRMNYIYDTPPRNKTYVREYTADELRYAASCQRYIGKNRDTIAEMLEWAADKIEGVVHLPAG